MNDLQESRAAYADCSINYDSLREQEHQVRCRLIDALFWLEVWIKNGPPTEQERAHVASFVMKMRELYGDSKVPYGTAPLNEGVRNG